MGVSSIICACWFLWRLTRQIPWIKPLVCLCVCVISSFSVFWSRSDSHCLQSLKQRSKCLGLVSFSQVSVFTVSCSPLLFHHLLFLDFSLSYFPLPFTSPVPVSSFAKNPTPAAANSRRNVGQVSTHRSSHKSWSRLVTRSTLSTKIYMWELYEKVVCAVCIANLNKEELWSKSSTYWEIHFPLSRREIDSYIYISVLNTRLQPGLVYLSFAQRLKKVNRSANQMVTDHFLVSSRSVYWLYGKLQVTTRLQEVTVSGT